MGETSERQSSRHCLVSYYRLRRTHLSICSEEFKVSPFTSPMSSNEDDFNDADTPVNQGLKKRRVQRACDICRRKKSKSKRLYHQIIFSSRISSSMSVSFTSPMPSAALNIYHRRWCPNARTSMLELRVISSWVHIRRSVQSMVLLYWSRQRYIDRPS